MRELPILFRDDMVRAILDGRKTVTRRLVKPQPTRLGDRTGHPLHDPTSAAIPCPFDREGKNYHWPPRPGLRLWVWEAWRPLLELPQCRDASDIRFRASADEAEWATNCWRNPTHMPKWASRLWLEVTAVRVERVQDITEEGARSEGVAAAWLDVDGQHVNHGTRPTFRQGFARTWNEINAKSGRGWDANPWVWVVEFRARELPGAANLAPVDLICGGFPCQDLSPAGRGDGLRGSRSGLWSEFRRIVGELRPRWCVIENTGGAASRWVDVIRGELELEGYATVPLPLQASWLGAPYRRARVFVVGCRADGGCASGGRRRLPERQGAAGRNAGGMPEADQAGADAPDPDRGELRHERERVPGRREGELRARGKEELAGDAAHADAEREQQRGGSVTDERGRTADSGRENRARHWAAEPGVARMVPGLRRGVDSRLRRAREKALGNCVIPQCAEVVGLCIQKWRGVA